MEDFEKQQTIEGIKTVVKARWFYVSGMVVQVIIFKLLFRQKGIALPPNPWLTLIFLAVFLFNLFFWLYVRRPPEKINNRFLKIIKFSQVPFEQAALSLTFYFSGTVNKMLVMMYIMPIMVSSVLHKRKGVIAATASIMILYSGLAYLEYSNHLPSMSLADIGASSGRPLRGDLNLTKNHIIGFNLYIIGSAFYAGYLANLLKRREKRAIDQGSDLNQKTELLVGQTKELTETKNWLHEALTKSDKERITQSHLKEEIEKVNNQLQGRIKELETFDKVTIGRELKMADLKKEITALKEENEKLKSRIASASD